MRRIYYCGWWIEDLGEEFVAMVKAEIDRLLDRWYASLDDDY